MASSENSNNNNFILKGVAALNREELGYKSYGRVYAVKYCEMIYAAKEIWSTLVEDVEEIERKQIIEFILQKGRLWSMLRHPNIVPFFGVYYPNGEGAAGKMRLPVMVMEMMADSLESFVDKHNNIPVHIKYSIVHDVALGLCYLHNHNPPIIHQNLLPSNVLLTAHLLAKISDFGVTKVIKSDSSMTTVVKVADFMPPEVLKNTPEYGPFTDIFSFAGIILHTFNQHWPTPIELMQFDSKSIKKLTLSEVERRQHWLDKMIGEASAEALTPLVEECLNYEPAMRPNIANVCKRIQANKDAYKKEFPEYHDVITLHQQNIQLKGETTQQRFENERLRNENSQMNTTIEKQKTKIQEMVNYSYLLYSHT